MQLVFQEHLELQELQEPQVSQASRVPKVHKAQLACVVIQVPLVLMVSWEPLVKMVPQVFKVSLDRLALPGLQGLPEPSEQQAPMELMADLVLAGHLDKGAKRDLQVIQGTRVNKGRLV